LLIGLLKWVGGKASMLEYILPRFPKGYKTYVEVFGGSGTVMFSKQRPGIKEIYNDFDSNLTNLFNIVKFRPIEFVNEVGLYSLNSRDDFFMLKRFLNDKCNPYSDIDKNMDLTEVMLPYPESNEIMELLYKRADDKALQKAVAFYKVISHSFAAGGRTFNSQPSTIVSIGEHISRCSYRLRKVVIENQDFEQLIKHYDRLDTFFYLDPPYFSTENYYTAVFTKEDHVRLYKALSNITGKFLLSYNDCDYIRELYKDYYIFSTGRVNNISNKKDSEFRELLIANYNITDNDELNNLQIQALELFE
jgi:DNA adenine methylase